MEMNSKQIKISGFKSIADIELNELAPYSIFAGANSSGKSIFLMHYSLRPSTSSGRLG
jgi:AAA15 family ATPase/GTPase